MATCTDRLATDDELLQLGRRDEQEFQVLLGRYEVLTASTTKDLLLQVFRSSPLTDSNRRPPPYHLLITLLLQIAPSRRVGRARACPRVPRLMYPSRTR
jgi:hypothetical protein